MKPRGMGQKQMAIAANGKNLMIFGSRQMAPTLSSLRQRQVVLVD
jgi:hypothetical protein